MDDVKKITIIAVLSRLCVLILQCVANFLIPDHDANDVFISPGFSDAQSKSNGVIDFFFGGLVRWDAQYFLHISVYGYTYENCLAFFPLFPVLVRMYSNLCNFIFSSQSRIYNHLITSILMNFIVFVLTARMLYHLSRKVLKNTRIAYYSAILFCLNPASIFFSAPYSETLFSYFTFTGMFYDDVYRSVIFFAFSAYARSNGIINVGFVVYRTIKYYIYCYLKKNTAAVNIAMRIIFHCLILLLITCSLFILYQLVGYYNFCKYSFEINNPLVLQYAKEKNFTLAGSRSGGVCNMRIPVPYFYVQKHYWNLGFMKYFTIKQIPNFILAFPMAYIILSKSVNYFIQHEHLLYTLDLFESSVPRRKRRKTDFYVLPDATFVYVLHVTFLSIFCIFCSYVQIITRLISCSSPVLYWFSAIVIYNAEISIKKNSSEVCRERFLIEAYFISYFFLGIILFSNFYPWT